MTGLMLSFSLLTGCAVVPTVPNESLAQFTASVESLKKDTDASFSGITVASEARFKADLIEELGDEGDELLEQLTIRTNFKTLSAKEVPYFLNLKRLKAEVGQLNTSLIDYVALLKGLSDPNAISKETFDTLAHSLNKNVLAAAPSIKSTTGKDDTGLFSVTAMALTKNYLQSKQTGVLVGAIRNNQPTIQRFAAQQQKAVVAIARAVDTEYEHEMQALRINALTAKDRTNSVSQLVERSSKHFADLQNLKRLHANYGRLPLMHAEIADAIQVGNRGLPLVVRMLETTEKLKKDYEKTLTTEAPVTAPAPGVNPVAPVPPAPDSVTTPAVPTS